MPGPELPPEFDEKCNEKDDGMVKEKYQEFPDTKAQDESKDPKEDQMFTDFVSEMKADVEKAYGFVEEKKEVSNSKSELEASIQKRGDNSYYYAHNYEGQEFNNENAKKFYGDGLI